MRKYLIVPMGKVCYEQAILRYVPTFACLTGAIEYGDYSCLRTVFDAKDTARTPGDWTFSMELNEEDAAVITATRILEWKKMKRGRRNGQL